MCASKLQCARNTNVVRTEFDAERRKKEQALLVPDKEAQSLEVKLQKSVSSWDFSTSIWRCGGKDETDTGSTGNLEQKKLEMKEGY